MKVVLRAVGVAPLITHNERLADPLDPIVRELKKFTALRKKTDEDHVEIGRLEFLGGMYTDPPLELAMNGNTPPPGLPAWNILRCLQEGGKRSRLGRQVLQGIRPCVQHVPIQYDGPTNPHDMWTDGRFYIRKAIGVQSARTMRTRPMFVDWAVELPVEVDLKVFNLDTLRNIWEEAGRYVGLCEMRPIYGTFTATVLDGEGAKAKAGKVKVAA